MASPTLSVLMPNYNHGRYLPESLGALVSQSHRPAEILVLDDASTDASVSVIESFAGAHDHLRLVRNHQNLGVVRATMRLVDMSSGDYLFFAAADDKVLPEFFRRSMALLEQHPGAALCSCLALDIDERGRANGLVPLPMPRRSPGYLTPRQCELTLRRHGPWIVGPTTIFRRDAFVADGGFRPELGPFCDELLQQVLMLRHGACFIPEPLACWRTLDTGYLHSTYEDIDALMGVLDEALALMRSTWQDVFRPSYVRQFERRRRFSAGRYHLTREPRGGQRDLAHVFARILKDSSRLDAALLRQPRGRTAVVQRLLSQVWLAGRLGVSPLWLLRRSAHKLARAADMRAFAKTRPSTSGELEPKRRPSPND